MLNLTRLRSYINKSKDDLAEFIHCTTICFIVPRTNHQAQYINLKDKLSHYKLMNIRVKVIKLKLNFGKFKSIFVSAFVHHFIPTVEGCLFWLEQYVINFC